MSIQIIEMDKSSRETLEKVLTEKIIECENLKKKNAELEKENEQITKYRLEAQEFTLRNSLLASEKEKLMDVIRSQMAEIDEIKNKLAAEEKAFEKLKDLEIENEHLKEQIAKSEKEIKVQVNAPNGESITCDGNDIVEQLSKQLEELTMTNQIYQKQIEIMSSQKNDLTMEVETYKFQLKKLENKINAEQENKDKPDSILEKFEKKEGSSTNSTPPDGHTRLVSSDYAKKIVIREL